MSKQQERVILGIKVDVAEKKYDAKYVGLYDLPDAEGPYLVFYKEKPDTSKGHDNYFGLFRPYRPGDEDAIYIINAKSIRLATFAAIEHAPGCFTVSRYIHDYVETPNGNGFLDGGLAYTRYNPDYPPTHTMKIVDGEEVFTPAPGWGKRVGEVEAAKGGVVALELPQRTEPLKNTWPVCNGITLAMADVADFHEGCDQPILTIPQFPSEERIQLRHDLIAEEWKEYQDAVEARDIVGVADALGDIIYVVIGTMLEFGIPGDVVWAEIQRSNMLKIDPVTGKALKYPNGKVKKPEGWTPPDIRKAIAMAGMPADKG